jgi:hypothetical protein
MKHIGRYKTINDFYYTIFNQLLAIHLFTYCHQKLLKERERATILDLSLF